MRESPTRGNPPLAYFVTLSCYGARLHGSPKLTVDRNHNSIHSRYVSIDHRREATERGLMLEDPAMLEKAARDVVLTSMRETCEYRDWNLHVIHVRSNHVHLVVDATSAGTSVVLRVLKTRSSRALNEQFGHRRWWSRHGTLWLWKRDQLAAAIAYTWEQDEPMERWRAQ